MPAVQARPPHPVTRKRSCRIVLAYGRSVRYFHIRPWLTGMALFFAGLFAVFYFAATGYLIFRDDLLAASLARQTRLKQAYEDRVASLRADIDRIASRQLLNQEDFEEQLERLVGRQALLDARQDMLAGLSRTASGVGFLAKDAARPASNEAKDDDLTTGSIAPVAAPSVVFAYAGDIDNGAEPLPLSNEEFRLDAVETSLDELAREQVAYVEDLASHVAERSEKLAAVLEEIGRATPSKGDDAEATGGPFVPLDSDAGPEIFGAAVALVTAQLERFDALQETASQLPLDKPMADASVTSRFGMRMDPFRRRPAMHTGIDFRAPSGQPARATAAGTVVTAGYSRGYGYMVEIDHGEGLVTRYAHLSRVLAKKGQKVDRGAIVGRTGSTGRSTGPHLHYEIRIGGRAVDPMTFIRAGSEISPLL
jgi:murein DD-endopeptidase MepM/ murein hydrolase activator NlpD